MGNDRELVPPSWLLKLGGRKFLAMIIGVIAVGLHNYFGYDTNTMLTIAGIVTAFIFGNVASDVAAGTNSVQQANIQADVAAVQAQADTNTAILAGQRPNIAPQAAPVQVLTPKPTSQQAAIDLAVELTRAGVGNSVSLETFAKNMEEAKKHV